MRQMTINGNAMADNLRVVRAAAGSAVIYGVLKADGYGLGLEPMARGLAMQGIDRFAVTEPTAAEKLLELGLPVREILLLRPVTEAEAERLLHEPVTFSVGSAEEAAALARAAAREGVRPAVHVQIDTGLGRYGLSWDEPERILYLYNSFTALRFTGIYTHFGCPCRSRAVQKQYGRFVSVLNLLEKKGIDVGRRHCCESSALLRHPDMVMDAVRVGSAFLGRVPGAEEFGLRDICRCEVSLETVRTLYPGDTVGYGLHYRAKKEMRVAVADIGALHGLGAASRNGRESFRMGLRKWLGAGVSMLRGNGLYAEANGRKLPVLGQLCTECCILDVTDAEEETGDVVTFSLNPMFARNVERIWQYGAVRVPMEG